MKITKCPLCDWGVTEGGIFNLLKAQDDAVFGRNIFQSIDVDQSVDAELQRHLQSHSIDEWVREVTRLKLQLGEAYGYTKT